MKITKSTNKIISNKLDKHVANIGCNICPSCGESRKMIDCIHQGLIIIGISSGTCKTYAKGFFNMKSYKVDCYTCNTCGTEWESEEYEY